MTSFGLKELERLYPDRIVINLISNIKLYTRLKSEMINNGYSSLQKYLLDNGFVYGVDARITIQEKELKDALTQYYPNKIISGLSVEHKDIYPTVVSIAKYYNCSVSEYIENLGFQYQKLYNKNQTIDSKAAKRLCDEMNLHMSDIANFVNLSRQRAEQVIKRKQKHYSNIWNWKNFTNDDHDILLLMIEEKLFIFDYDDTVYHIYVNKDQKICLLCHNEASVHCLFDENIPADIKNAIIDHKMHIYNDIDFAVLNNCKIVHILKEKYICMNSPDAEKLFVKGRNRYSQICNEKKSTSEYCIHLGFKGKCTGKDKNTDENIIEYFKENLINGKVYISSDSKNQWFRSYASRTGYGSEGLIKYLGFEVSDYHAPISFDHSTLRNKTDEKYRKELKNYLITGSNNIISLSSQTSFYNNLYALARTRKLSIDEYLEILGYYRQNDETGEILIVPSFIREKRNAIIRLASDIENELKRNKKENQKNTISIEQRSRNRTLVDRLRKVYDFKCQICKEHFPITKSNGDLYVEVHHIKPLSEEGKFTNMAFNYEIPEDECLDTESNMIVVCPNHHRYLHFNADGHYELIKIQDQLFLENPSGDRLEIIENYHLGYDL